MSGSPEALLKRLLVNIIDALEVHEKNPDSTIDGVTSLEFTHSLIRSRAKLALHMMNNTYELTLKARRLTLKTGRNDL